MTIQKDKQRYDEKTHQWVEIEPATPHAKTPADDPVPVVEKPAHQPKAKE
jgi:hypothetical protein